MDKYTILAKRIYDLKVLGKKEVEVLHLKNSSKSEALYKIGNAILDYNSFFQTFAPKLIKG